jgi:hypothetical protein
LGARPSTDSDSDRDFDANPDANSDSHPDGDSDAKADSNADGDSDAKADSHANPETVSHFTGVRIGAPTTWTSTGAHRT